MDRIDAQVDAQPGAQVAFKAEQEHPTVGEIAADRDVLARVLDRHSVSQETLARRCNVAPGYLSRMLSGQYPITLAIYLAAWQMTRDPELVGIFAGDGARVVVVDDQLAHSLHSLRHFAARACERVCGSSDEPSAPAQGKRLAVPSPSGCCPPPALDLNSRNLRDHGDPRVVKQLDVMG